MSNLLFTEVSVEEQEIVAGGVDALSGSGAFYDANIFNKNFSTAGPTGASSGSVSSVKVKSGAFNLSALFGL